MNELYRFVPPSPNIHTTGGSLRFLIWYFFRYQGDFEVYYLIKRASTNFKRITTNP